MTRRNLVQEFMDEYIAWGGPVIRRSVALADLQARGFDREAIDVLVFARQAVPAPEDPEAHLAVFREMTARSQ
jgi:hypothetical protein